MTIEEDIMNKEASVPCIDCICLPICRHKPFNDFYNACNIIRNAIIADIHSSTSAAYPYCYWIYKVIKPSKWLVNPSAGFGIEKIG